MRTQETDMSDTDSFKLHPKSEIRIPTTESGNPDEL